MDIDVGVAAGYEDVAARPEDIPTGSSDELHPQPVPADNAIRNFLQHTSFISQVVMPEQQEQLDNAEAASRTYKSKADKNADNWKSWFPNDCNDVILSSILSLLR